MSIFVKLPHEQVRALTEEIAQASRAPAGSSLGPFGILSGDTREKERLAALEEVRNLLEQGGVKIMAPHELKALAAAHHKSPEAARELLNHFAEGGHFTLLIPEQRRLRGHAGAPDTPLPLGFFRAEKFVRLVNPGAFWPLRRERIAAQQTAKQEREKEGLARALEAKARAERKKAKKMRRRENLDRRAEENRARARER